MTAAGSITARSSRLRLSRRDASRAWIVGGTAACSTSPVARQLPSSKRMSPSSMSIESSCSTKSGFPSAASTMRARTRSSRPALPSRCSATALVSSAESGSSSIRLARSDVDHSGWRSRSSRRVGQSTSTGASPFATTCSRSSRNVASAQWTSSNTTTSGRSAASVSKSLRVAHEDVLHRERLLGQPDRRLHARDDVSVVHERAQLRPRLRGRVALDDARGLTHGLRERPEGDAVAVRKAPPPEHDRVLGGRAHELLDEARLPDAGLADDGHEPGATRLDGVPIRVIEDRELLLAADHGGVQASRPFRILAHRLELVGGHRLRLALELERLDLLDLDVVADEPVRQLAEQHLVLAGRLLEPGRHVDRVARHEPLARRRIAGDDLTRVDARPVREPHAPVPVELLVQLVEGALHPGRRTDRS